MPKWKAPPKTQMINLILELKTNCTKDQRSLCRLIYTSAKSTEKIWNNYILTGLHKKLWDTWVLNGSIWVKNKRKFSMNRQFKTKQGMTMKFQNNPALRSRRHVRGFIENFLQGLLCSVLILSWMSSRKIKIHQKFWKIIKIQIINPRMITINKRILKKTNCKMIQIALSNKVLLAI